MYYCISCTFLTSKTVFIYLYDIGSDYDITQNIYSKNQSNRYICFLLLLEKKYYQDICLLYLSDVVKFLFEGLFPFFVFLLWFQKLRSCILNWFLFCIWYHRKLHWDNIIKLHKLIILLLCFIWQFVYLYRIIIYYC